MDNIQDKIAQLMSDPQTLSQVQSLSKMLGFDKPVEEKPPEKEEGQLPVEMISKITKLMPLFQQANQEDDTTRLLLALRPFLSEEKCRKLDSAKKMIKMIKLIPLLKDGGLIDFSTF